jgi:cytochrome c-type biogenesis protein CcmH/NrfF
VTTAPILAQLATVALLAAPTEANPALPTLAQVQQSEGHYNEGELGEKFLFIETSLKCDCGCGLDVHSCQFQMQCGTSPVWSERIRRDLEAGLSVEAIQASFVADFGPTVLMAPPAEGFNLLGYLLPAFAIVISGMLVGLVIRGGAGRKQQLVPVEEASDEQQERLAAEIKKLEQAESPDW